MGNKWLWEFIKPLFPTESRVCHDGVDGGAKRGILLSNRLEDGVDMRTVSPGDFATMRVADEFPDDALENAFPVGHQGGLERRQVAHLTTIGKFHGSINRYLCEMDFFCERRSLSLDREFFHVTILTPFASNRVVVFKGETEGIDLRMTAGAAFEFLVLENGFADGGGTPDVRLVDQHVGGRFDAFVVEILENPRAPVDR